MDVLFNLDKLVLFVLGVTVAPMSGYAFVHTLRQRSDAFTAVDKLTKNLWLAITGTSAFILLVFPVWLALLTAGGWNIILVFQGPRSGGALLWLAALVAVLVYLVDVKPAVVGVQGGGQRW